MKTKLTAVLVALVLFAAGTNTAWAQTAGGSTLRYAIWSSPKGVFNPILYNDIYDYRVVALTYSALLALDANNTIIPALADSYTLSKDNKTITFKLNKKAKWHDGVDFNADDVAFTFASIASPDYKGPRYGEIDKIVGVKDFHDGKATTIPGIKVIDADTISFTYTDVFAPALANFAIRGIVPKHIWSKYPVGDWDKQAADLKAAVGTGPFKLVTFVPDQYVELARNDDFFLGAPKLAKFILKVSNQATAQSELIKGDLDIAVLSSLKQKDIDVYKDAGITVLEYAGTGYQFLTINNDDPKFADKRVRQALAYAINRKGIVDKLLEGHGKVLNTALTLSSWAYPADLNTYDYSADKAKALLKEAGWTLSGDVLTKGGEPFKVTILVPIGNKVREQSAPVIQQNLKAVGIDATLVNLDFASLKAKVSDQHDYELALMGFSLEVDPADAKTYWHSSIANKPGFNLANFKNPASDKLLDEGAQSLDVKSRQAVYQKWGKLINDEEPFVFLYSANEGRAFTPKLQGYNFSTYVEFPNIQNWTLAK